MRFSAKRLRPMFDNLEEAYGRYQSRQIDAIRGHRDGQGARRRGGAAPADARPASTALADRVFRADFLVMAYEGALQLVAFASFGLFLFVGAIEVLDGKLTLGELVAFNALVALANGPMLIAALALGPGPARTVLLDRLDDILEHGAGAGRRPRRGCAGAHARGPRRAARTSASATAARRRRRSSKTSRSTSSRARRWRSSGAAAPARRR